MYNEKVDSLIAQVSELINTKEFLKAADVCKQIVEQESENGKGWYYYFLALNSKQKISECNISDSMVCDDYLEKAIQFTSGDINTELKDYKEKMESAFQLLKNGDAFINANEKITKYIKYADEDVQEKVRAGYKIVDDAKKINDSDVNVLMNYDTTCAKAKLLIDDIFNSGILNKVSDFIDVKEDTQPLIDKYNERISDAEENYDDHKAIEDDIQQDLDEVIQEIRSYDSDINGYRGNINKLKGSISVQNGKKLFAKEAADKSAIQRTINELQREINSYEREISKANTKISSLNTKASSIQMKLEKAKDATQVVVDKLNDAKQKLQDVYDDLEAKKQIVLDDLNVIFDDCHNISYKVLNYMCENNIKIDEKEDLFNMFNSTESFNSVFSTYIYDNRIVKNIYQYTRNVSSAEYDSYIKSLFNSLDEFTNNLGDYKNQDDYIAAKDLLFVNGTEEPSIVVEKLKDAKQRFEALNGYRDSKELITTAIYQIGKCLAFTKPADAIEYLQSVTGYNDADKIIEKCNLYITQANIDKKIKTMLYALIAAGVIVVIIIIAIIANAVR